MLARAFCACNGIAAEGDNSIGSTSFEGKSKPSEMVSYQGMDKEKCTHRTSLALLPQ